MSFFRNLLGKKPPKEATFPQRLELIEGKLYLHLFLHELPKHNAPTKTVGLACLTEGLYANGQKEILFVHVNKKREYVEVPNDIVIFAKQLFQLSSNNQIVDEGGHSQFGTKGLMGWKGVVYTTAPKHLKERYKSPTLSMILLTEEEAVAVPQVGALRVLSMLGNMYRYFPNPYWSDVDRAPLPIAQMLKQSFLTKVGARIQTPDITVTLANKQVTLQLRRNLKLNLPEEGIPSEYPVAILPALRSDTNACLTFAFDEAENGSAAISPSGSDGSVMGGCTLLLLGQQEQFATQTAEDGFIIMLKDEQWSEFWDAFSQKEELNFTNGYSNDFCVQWID